MFTLYTTHLNPKGVQAQQFMSKNNAQFNILYLDDSEESYSIKTAEKLLQDFTEQPSSSLELPFLTRQENGTERIVLQGFVPNEWEQFFQLSASGAAAAPAGIPAFDSSETAHVPVVGEQVPVVGVEAKPLQ